MIGDWPARRFIKASGYQYDAANRLTQIVNTLAGTGRKSEIVNPYTFDANPTPLRSGDFAATC